MTTRTSVLMIDESTCVWEAGRRENAAVDTVADDSWDLTSEHGSHNDMPAAISL